MKLFLISLIGFLVAVVFSAPVDDEQAAPSDDPEFQSGEFEGDMVSFSVIPDLSGEMNTAISDESKRWKNGIVPYVISDQFSVDEILMMNVAFNTFHDKTCVRFVPRCNSQEEAKFFGCDGVDYINIVPGGGCSSTVGRQGSGGQDVTLRPRGLDGNNNINNGCFTPGEPGRVMHEVLHALGFIHEQTRTDRDQFVTVDFSNIPQGKKNINFQIYTEPTDSFGEPYDYGSVMHYPKDAFAKVRGTNTITPKNGEAIGQRNDLSAVDIRKINKAYEKECNDRMKLPGGNSV